MDFPLPPVGEGLFEVELVRWLVAPGDHVRRGQGLMEVLSDKATMDVPAPFEGTITGLGITPGSKIGVGQVVLSYTAGPDNSDTETPAAPAAAPRVRANAPRSNGAAVATDTPAPPAGAPRPLPAAAPSVRLVARQFGIDLANVAGTGPNGRILLEDLTPFLTPRNGVPAQAEAAKPEAAAIDVGVAGTTLKLAGLRRKIAEHMVAAKKHIPHYSYIDECDFTDLVRLRDQLRESFQKAGIKLTYLAFIVKAVARALREVPFVNATYDEAKEEISLHDHYNIGIAVATRTGLVVPVVRNADKKDIAAIAREIERLSTEARAGKAKLEDLRGGTFTLTSVGNVGGLISTPIINHPEVGIMGVGKVVKRPVYDAAGTIRPADMAYLSFSFDHRILDGAIGATFGNTVVKHLQSPAALLLSEGFGG